MSIEDTYYQHAIIPQSHFKWIIVYQCHHTKFCIIWPLTSKRAAEAVGYISETLQHPVPIPMVDRGRGIHITSWESSLIVATTTYTPLLKTRILINKYSRNLFNLCPQRLLSQSDTIQDQQISLCHALKTSATGGQGFVRCDCCSLL